MYCPNCGKQVQDDFILCPFCGYRLPVKESAPIQRPQPQKPTPVSTPSRPAKGSRLAVNAAIAIVVLIVVVLVGYALLTTPGLIPGIGKPASVVVSGTVTATGTGAVPEKLTFTSTHGGASYIAGCSGGGNPSSYSISLPNGDTYEVTMTYKFLGFTAGTANVGTLDLDTYASSILMNWSG